MTWSADGPSSTFAIRRPHEPIAGFSTAGIPDLVDRLRAASGESATIVRGVGIPRSASRSEVRILSPARSTTSGALTVGTP